MPTFGHDKALKLNSMADVYIITIIRHGAVSYSEMDK